MQQETRMIEELCEVTSVLATVEPDALVVLWDLPRQTHPVDSDGGDARGRTSDDESGRGGSGQHREACKS